MKRDMPQMKQILLVLTVFVCYYGAEVEEFALVVCHESNVVQVVWS